LSPGGWLPTKGNLNRKHLTLSAIDYYKTLPDDSKQTVYDLLKVAAKNDSGLLSLSLAMEMVCEAGDDVSKAQLMVMDTEYAAECAKADAEYTAAEHDDGDSPF
jgi:hypothetical protein